MGKVAKQRLDLLLVEQNLCESRQVAQRLIRAGEVKVNDCVVDKPGTTVAIEATIVLRQKPPYVSRGGEKLAKALETFGIAVADRVCLDGGISTGGFTDCLLQRGAKQVYGVDVGYGQVDWKIRTDPRVILRERTNLRHLQPEDLYSPSPIPLGAASPSLNPDFDPDFDPDFSPDLDSDGHRSATPAAICPLWPDFGVLDLSFISLTKVLPAFWGLLAAPREAVLLVKPQFEVGRENVGKNGVVRDAKAQAGAIDRVCHAAQTQGWQIQGLTASPITGPAGNVEYLLWLRSVEAESEPELGENRGEGWPIDRILSLTQSTLKQFKTAPSS
ncbi:MAG: TlyA family RNA methyltransferase [Prochlorothrix sp.]